LPAWFWREAAGVLCGGLANPASVGGIGGVFQLASTSRLPEDGLRIGPRDEALLRNSALRTWRFFREFSNENENYLIPDILKEARWPDRASRFHD